MITERPWGTYETILDEPNYKVKRIVVRAGHQFSLQYHNLREEHWTIVSGRGYIQIGDKITATNAGQSYYIPEGEIHRATSILSDLVFIETQIGECNENDIVRIQDDYGRVSNRL